MCPARFCHSYDILTFLTFLAFLTASQYDVKLTGVGIQMELI